MICGIISISRGKSEGRPEGAKRPTAGDEPREFTSRGEGGRVPPFFEKLRFAVNFVAIWVSLGNPGWYCIVGKKMLRGGTVALKKQIGQLFVIGYQGIDPSPEFIEFVKEWGIGGVIFFVRNIQDPLHLPKVIDRLQEASGQTIFSAIDQEGGLVLRVLKGGSLFPGAMGLAASGDCDMVRRVAVAIAQEMRSLGLNWNLAPVLDINHAENPGIGARSFGDKPDLVARYGIPFIQGLQEGGVLACAKHFPGKGQAKLDSHLSLPTIPFDREHLMRNELHPFRAAIEAGVAAIMTAHVFFPAFESTPDLPATLSPRVLTELLRKDLGFNGLLITDDLEMGAITAAFGVADAAKRSFLAGADLLLICHDLERARETANAVLEEISSSEFAHRRLQESLDRIEKARIRLGSGSIRDMNLLELAAKHAPLMEEAHRSSVLVHSFREGAFPLKRSEKILAFCPKIASLVQVEEAHQQGGFLPLVESRFPNTTGMTFEPKGSSEEILGAFEALTERSYSNAPLLLFSYNAHLFRGQAEALRRISVEHHPTIVIAVRNPYDLSLFSDCDASMATFGFRTPSIDAALAILDGTDPVRRIPWPVSL